jgi:hypothetical protein
MVSNLVFLKSLPCAGAVIVLWLEPSLLSWVISKGRGLESMLMDVFFIAVEVSSLLKCEIYVAEPVVLFLLRRFSRDFFCYY